MREIVLDTETTGLDPVSGHRMVEIGCLELMDHVPTGNSYHVYINPDREVPEEAFRVHGLGNDFLDDKPLFPALAAEFLAFIGESPLVIHNAGFDMKFINFELQAAGFDPIPMERAVDTLAIARRKFPGSPASLDALCKRFQVDNARRDYHGALLDSELLAAVYLELMGGRQQGLMLAADAPATPGTVGEAAVEPTAAAEVRPPRPHAPTAEEDARHTAFLERIKEPIWLAGETSGQ